MYRLWQRLLSDSSGASVVEYGLIIAMIALGMSLALAVVGNGMQNLFLVVNNTTSNALTSP